MTKVLFLIGFRATGKTTLGRLLAQRWQCTWIDSDAKITTATQRSIAEIFSSEGEQGFRKIEQQVIADTVSALPKNELAVISLGGGAVLSAETRKLIRRRGRCVCLTASVDCLVARISATELETPRPALTGFDQRQEIETLLRDRQTVYSDCADYTLDTEVVNQEDAVEQIAQWWLGVDK
ncbi:MAG: shikimate kinase [Pirellulaceae bacterium]|nr:shikimate kinase [Pirellulaceae bacterium]